MQENGYGCDEYVMGEIQAIPLRDYRTAPRFEAALEHDGGVMQKQQHSTFIVF